MSLIAKRAMLLASTAAAALILSACSDDGSAPPSPAAHASAASTSASQVAQDSKPTVHTVKVRAKGFPGDLLMAVVGNYGKTHDTPTEVPASGTWTDSYQTTDDPDELIVFVSVQHISLEAPQSSDPPIVCNVWYDGKPIAFELGPQNVTCSLDHGIDASKSG